MRKDESDFSGFKRDMVPYNLSFPASPHLAAKKEKINIDPEKIENSFRRLEEAFDTVIVEGVGGAKVPLNKETLIVDMAQELRLSVLIVAENRLGTINHTLLTIEAIKNRKLPILGIVFNRASEAGDPEVLEDNILIVDDNATNREILNTCMTSWGMRVSETGDGPEALDSLYKALDENDPFRVAVIDMQMPGMDGEALGRAIKADSRLADTRMVILTSLGVRGDARRFAEIGFDAYLTKPARTLELKAVLSQVLSEHENEMMDLNTIFTRHTARETMNLFAGRKARILLAEDNFTNQQVALGILKKLGLSAEAVANGVEAVKALESIPYDLVLMDIQMPEMDGIAATREIRNLKLENRNPEGQVSSIPHPGSSVPIIAMTAHAMAGDREKCLKAGMNGYVSKPVSPRALAEALEKWLPPPGKSVKEEGEDVPSKLVEDPGSDDGTRVSIALPGLAGEGRIFDTQPSAHVFDKAALMSRLMSDVDLGRSVIGVFLEDMPKQISELKSLIGQGEAKQAGAQAHKIKGAAANIGGVALQQVAFEMEKAGKARNLDAVEMGMIELEKEFRRLKETMEREF